MNKALVTAMLLGLAAADDADEVAFAALRAKRADKSAAAEDCEDAGTAAARAAQARAVAEKGLLDTEKKRLDALLLAEQGILEKMTVNSDAAKEATKDALEFLTTAKTEADKADADIAKHKKIISDAADTVSGLKETMDKADKAVEAQDKLIETITTNIAELLKAKTQHDAEKVTLNKEYKTLDDAQKLAKKNLDDKKLDWDKAKELEQLAGCTHSAEAPCKNGKTVVGTKKLEADLKTTSEQATADKEAKAGKNTDASDATTEWRLFETLKEKNKIMVKQKKYAAAKTAACGALTATNCVVGDQIYELDAATWGQTAWQAEVDALAAHKVAYEALGDLIAKELIELKKYELAKAADTKQEGVEAGLKAEVGVEATLDGDGKVTSAATGLYKVLFDADAALVDPKKASDDVDKYAVSANTEYEKAVARKALLVAALEPLKVVAANEKAAYDKGNAATVQAGIDQALADIEKLRLDPYVEAANKAGARSKKYFDFYNDFTVAAQKRVDDTQKLIDAIADKKNPDAVPPKTSGTMELAEADIKACEEKVKAAVVRCKRRQYSDAIAALDAFTKDKGIQDKQNLKTKEDYDANRKKAIAKNLDCRKNKDLVRAECAPEECCGQANRYDRDGTRMTVEVCGSKDDSTYTYWPVMKEGMAKAPQTEQWRYYCITGAKNLAATTAAVVGALYMAY